MAKPEDVRSPAQIANQINCLKAGVIHQVDLEIAPSTEVPSDFDPCLSDDSIVIGLYTGDPYMFIPGAGWLVITVT